MASSTQNLYSALKIPVKNEFQESRFSANGDVQVVEISSSSSEFEQDEENDAGESSVASDVTSVPLQSAPVSIKRPNSFINNNNVEDSCQNSTEGLAYKRPKLEETNNFTNTGLDSSLPDDFLQPLEEISPQLRPQVQQLLVPPAPVVKPVFNRVSRQFWKAGDYESDKVGQRTLGGGIDHVRVHPKFLHSNATSHKWALGAIAELLDNALDEAIHGATFVKVDVVKNPRNGDPMLLIEDNGGGMNPDCMRQCVSLGYSAKSKIANTIGQYGNGFKTSTMRLGADAIVFSRCKGSEDGCGATQSIGMLSYTFLRETGQEDIIVPMVDFEIQPFGLKKLLRTNMEDWNRNVETITRWSPYASELELMNVFSDMKNQGTKILVYNLWEDDQGHLELDFNADHYDIQIRGANRDAKLISMAEKFPNSRHYLTYQYSLRSYSSILYLRLPPGFKIYLRGKEVEHHNLIDDLMYTQVSTYRPQCTSEMHRDTGQMKAVVTVGFVKDAKEHIDVQGFNVYHKNRLIKPFWRLWNSSASRGRGVIGVLEANFVEPAHDKQGFERTIVLTRLEARLVEMQKTYWTKYCHKVGYVNNTLREMQQNAANAQPGNVAAVPSTVPRPVQVLAPIPTNNVYVHPSQANRIQAQGFPSVSAQLPQHRHVQSAASPVPRPHHGQKAGLANASMSMPSIRPHQTTSVSTTTMPVMHQPLRLPDSTVPQVYPQVHSHLHGQSTASPMACHVQPRQRDNASTTSTQTPLRSVPHTSAGLTAGQGYSVFSTPRQQPVNKAVSQQYQDYVHPQNILSPAEGSSRGVYDNSQPCVGDISVQAVQQPVGKSCPVSTVNASAPTSDINHTGVVENEAVGQPNHQVSQQGVSSIDALNRSTTGPMLRCSNCNDMGATSGNVSHATSEQGAVRPLKPNNEMNRQALADLGRMFVKKAASITVGQPSPHAEQQEKESQPKQQAQAPEEERAVANGEIELRDMETRVAEMEQEVKVLEERLSQVTAERDSLKRQLENDRLQGALSRKELEKKVQEAFERLRELEAENMQLQAADK